MPYFLGTDKYGFLESIQFNGRVALNLETQGLRSTDPEIWTSSPTTEKGMKAMKAAKGVYNIIKGSAQVRAGFLLLVPDPILGPVDEAVGGALILKGTWSMAKGAKSLAEVAMA